METRNTKHGISGEEEGVGGGCSEWRMNLRLECIESARGKFEEKEDVE